MKKIPMGILTLASLCLLGNLPLSAKDEQTTAAKEFPYEITFEAGASGFIQGDHITILSVRGDRPHLKPGGSYLVEGEYTLASDEHADLALFCTTRGKSGPTPIQDGQRIHVSRGSGKFHLYETNLADGWLHLSFYPRHSSLHGGVYFGERGRDGTIMKNQSWFDNVTGKSAAVTPNDNDANRILIDYIGQPVLPPAGMDVKYSKDGLNTAIQLAARNAGITLKGFQISDREFPFLVGVICGGSDVSKLKAEFKKMDGYQYQGSIGNDSNSDGSDTCNVFSIVPYGAYPAGSREQIQHRLMLRYEVFYERLSALQ